MNANDKKLTVTLQGDKEFIMQRAFDAPRHLVFETMSNPEYVRRWWCCMDGFTMPVCEIDFRVGGKWRYLMIGPDGSEVEFYGEYLEIAAPDRIVQTEFFAPFPEEKTVCTMTLEEKNGMTYYRCHVAHATAMGRDMHLQSGMEAGAAIALDRLEAVARSLPVAA